MPSATSAADLADLDDLRAQSGLDFMLSIQRGDRPGAPIAEALGFTLDHVEDGEVRFTGTPRFLTLNPMGGVHGGWYGTLLDSAMGCAVMTKVPCGSTYTTLEYKVNITRALPVDTRIVATGTVVHSGRSTGIAQGEIRGAEDGRLYATGSTTCLIMALPVV